ncbi:PDZ/DHR/GLGF domain containing protein [Bifidobacterium avesanii]|nr:PDZ/DHR/GLGF domain containing protein [Bifidobacterium avesanii]
MTARVRHVRAWARSRTPLFKLGAAGVVLCVVALVLPSPYVIERPGPTADVLGESGGAPIIAITGADTHPDTGKLLLTTVNASGMPGYPALNAEALWGWFSPGQIVMPREAFVPSGQTAEEYKEQTERQMTGSQDSAAAAALAFLKARGVDTDGVTVSMHVDDIGGPSAGMMYALGVIDKLTEAQETGGLTVAGTGTIDADGKVGAIGGIQLKMIAAKRDGASWFLAPKDNCSSVVGHVPAGLTDVAVSTLGEAYDALTAIGEGRGGDLPRCTAQ